MKDRLAKLLSSSFLMCLAGAIYEALNGQPVLALVAVLAYLAMDRLPQIIAVLKGLDVLGETFGLTKVDKVLDQAVAAMEAKLSGNTATLAVAGAPGGEVMVSTPIADTLGK